MQVRATLLNTSCAASDQPEVCEWARSDERARVLRVELLHELGPKETRGAKLRHLHEEVHADRPEERQPRRKPVDIESGFDAGADIFDAVGERVGELQVLRRAGLLHVIAGDRDRVELRHLLRRVGEDVGDDAEAGCGRIDVGVAHHEFFEDVVLDRAAKFFRRHALFLGGDDVERHDRQHRAVHGHRHGHLVERDAGEQRPHVVDRVDRDTGHADVAGDARMVAVVAAVGGEIEGDREALLSGGEVAAVEGVGVFGGGEAGVLPDRPGLGDIHGRVGAAQIRRDAGIAVEAGEAVQVVGAVGGFDRNAFGRQPGFCATAGREPPLSGRNRSWRSPEYGSSFRLRGQNIMGGLQRRQRIATREDEGSNAGSLERIGVFRPAGQIDMRCARRLQRLGGVDGVALINGVC